MMILTGYSNEEYNEVRDFCLMNAEFPETMEALEFPKVLN